jgi:L-2-hydroxyglutarate oxidase
MQDWTDVTVVGAGAVGLSAAVQLARRYPGLRLRVLEKEAEVAAHQTGHNSGVIHSGIYYKPGSAKARLCISGREELVAFCKERGVAHEVCGKVIVALTESELPQLDKVYQTGLANGLPEIRKISPAELRDIEPHSAGIAAIHVPYTGIVDFPGVCRALRDELISLGHSVEFGQPVQRIERSPDGYILHTPNAQWKSRYLVSCAGLHSDRLARMEGLRPTARIVGFRGDYYDLVHSAEHKVRSLIYPVPNPAFPFLGVHFTRMVGGGVEVGPNAVFTFKREGYRKTDFSLRDTADALSFAGTWQLFARHWRLGLGEYQRAFSKRLFWQQVRRLVPRIEMGELTPGRAGVRAMALAADGSMLDDFVIAQHDRSLHVLNAPSPAATACLAIGREIAARAGEHFSFSA